MYFLEISTLGELDFAIVATFYGVIILLILCIIMFFVETLPEYIKDRKERKRRNKNRKGYVKFDQEGKW